MYVSTFLADYGISVYSAATKLNSSPNSNDTYLNEIAIH
jgi:hypothetical protein